MKVTYILHSGFSLELEGVTLLFDYYKGDMPAFDKSKPLYVFASHRHHDHFSRGVYSLAEEGYSVKYILSNDIPVRERGLDITSIGPGACLELDGLKISTLASTDTGVAFIVEAEGACIYHAGDLNLWVWEEESEEYNKNMTEAFLSQMELIKGRGFDAAFLPLDPRQEGDFDKGMNAFCKRCSARHIFPMHLWEDYAAIDALLQKDPPYAAAVAHITGPGQVFEIK